MPSSNSQSCPHEGRSVPRIEYLYFTGGSMRMRAAVCDRITRARTLSSTKAKKAMPRSIGAASLIARARRLSRMPLYATPCAGSCRTNRAPAAAMRLLVFFLATTFLVEAIVMLVLPGLFPADASPVLAGAVDAALLVTILGPITSWVFVVPLQRMRDGRRFLLSRILSAQEDECTRACDYCSRARRTCGLPASAERTARCWSFFAGARSPSAS